MTGNSAASSATLHAGIVKTGCTLRKHFVDKAPRLNKAPRRDVTSWLFYLQGASTGDRRMRASQYSAWSPHKYVSVGIIGRPYKDDFDTF